MSPFLKIIFRFVAVLIVIFFAIQPYNWYCQLTQKCSKFSIREHIPSKKGSVLFKVEFGITNYYQDIDFKAEKEFIETLTGKKNIVKFKIKNNAKKRVRIYLQMHAEPEGFMSFLERYECLCNSKYKLKPGEEIELKMVFRVKNDLDKYLSGSAAKIPPMKIRYELKTY